MTTYEDVATKERLEREKEQRDKELKEASLNKQRKMWEKRQEELRKAAPMAIDPVFVKNQLRKCAEEIEKIDKVLIGL